MNLTSRTFCVTCGSPLDPERSCPRCLLGTGLSNVASGDGPSPIPPLARDAIPGYELLEPIGRGGAGVVWRARHEKLDRAVAIKIMHPEVAAVRGFPDRFRLKAQTLAGLSHQHIMTVHDFGKKDDLYYLVMECVDGINLRELMEGDPLDAEFAVDLVAQVCAALTYAHEEGVVHRDIKPENILVDRKGRVRIADFGLAKLVGEGRPHKSLTTATHRLGTPHYMAPEQVNTPKRVDHRVDIYGLGVVFYEMLTGELPIGQFSPPSASGRADPALDAIVLRALEHAPERRYQKAGDLLADLERHSRSHATTSAPASDPARLASFPSLLRWQNLFGLLGAGLALLPWFRMSAPGAGYHHGGGAVALVGFLMIPLVHFAHFCWEDWQTAQGRRIPKDDRSKFLRVSDFIGAGLAFVGCLTAVTDRAHGRMEPAGIAAHALAFALLLGLLLGVVVPALARAGAHPRLPVIFKSLRNLALAFAIGGVCTFALPWRVDEPCSVAAALSTGPGGALIATFVAVAVAVLVTWRSPILWVDAMVILAGGVVAAALATPGLLSASEAMGGGRVAALVVAITLVVLGLAVLFLALASSLSGRAPDRPR